LIVVTD